LLGERKNALHNLALPSVKNTDSTKFHKNAFCSTFTNYVTDDSLVTVEMVLSNYPDNRYGYESNRAFVFGVFGSV
jgi:hypothetical protein